MKSYGKTWSSLSKLKYYVVMSEQITHMEMSTHAMGMQRGLWVHKNKNQNTFK